MKLFNCFKRSGGDETDWKFPSLDLFTVSMPQAKIQLLSAIMFIHSFRAIKAINNGSLLNWFWSFPSAICDDRFFRTRLGLLLNKRLARTERGKLWNLGNINSAVEHHLASRGGNSSRFPGTGNLLLGLLHGRQGRNSIWFQQFILGCCVHCRSYNSNRRKCTWS